MRNARDLREQQTNTVLHSTRMWATTSFGVPSHWVLRHPRRFSVPNSRHFRAHDNGDYRRQAFSVWRSKERHACRNERSIVCGNVVTALWPAGKDPWEPAGHETDGHRRSFLLGRSTVATRIRRRRCNARSRWSAARNTRILGDGRSSVDAIAFQSILWRLRRSVPHAFLLQLRQLRNIFLRWVFFKTYLNVLKYFFLKIQKTSALPAA